MIRQYDPKFDLKINVGHSDYISRSSNFASYLEKYLMFKHYTCITRSNNFALYLEKYLMYKHYTYDRTM